MLNFPVSFCSWCLLMTDKELPFIGGLSTPEAVLFLVIDCEFKAISLMNASSAKLLVNHLCIYQVEEYDVKVAAIRVEEAEVLQQRRQLETTQRQLEVFKKETKYLPIIEECKEKIAKIDIKLSALREAR